MKKKYYLPIFLLFSLLYSCGNKLPEQKAETPVSSGTMSGEDNYKKFCIACHGSDGNLGISGAKSIPNSALSQQDREVIITNGKGTMPAFKEKLSTEEIKRLAEYTLTLK
jgi:mono/diheme cytochrome c family protein